MLDQTPDQPGAPRAHTGDAHGRTSAPMRIGLVAPPVLPIPPRRYAGTERIVAVLADELTARGHQVTLFASGDSTAECEVVPVVPRSVWSGRAAGEVAPLAMLSATLATEQAARFDVIHSHVDVAGLLMARLAAAPVVTTFHQRLDLPGAYESVLAFRDAPLVAISHSQRRWHPTANWIATIPHGLPLGRMPFSAEPGEYLAVVGRAAPEKGLAEAIEVAAQAGLPLRIAAKALHGSELAYIETYVRPALVNGVEYLGEVGPDERDPLLAGALATLMLGAWPEPFGLVAIESLATGTPVIARRAGALPEIVEHGVDGFLVDDLDEAVLAVRLADGLDRAVIRARALERFEVGRMVDAYERVYRDLVGGPVRPSAPAGADGSRPSLGRLSPLIGIEIAPGRPDGTTPVAATTARTDGPRGLRTGDGPG